jgi:putative membrane protein
MRFEMKRIITFFTFLIFSVPVALFAQWRDGNGCWGFGGRHFGFGGGIMMIVGIVVLAVIVFFAARMFRTQGNPFASDPVSILKARYAKGEITKEQFQEMKKDLQ